MKKTPSTSKSRALKLGRVRGLAAAELTVATGGDGDGVKDGDAAFMTLKFDPWRTRN